MPTETKNLPAITYYSPTEILGIYRSYFERGKTNNVVWLQGIYVQSPNQNRQWACAFDELRDANSNNTVKLKISWQDREKLTNNSLVRIGGLIEITQYTNSTIQISLNVTRFETVQDQAISEDDLKRIEYRQQKVAKGFINMDTLLEGMLFNNERPKIVLVIAATGEVVKDFWNGIRAAGVAIDFLEAKTTFRPAPLCTALKELDQRGYTAIALVRGGGLDPNVDVDDPTVIQTVVNMKTPIISGLGHTPEKIFLRQVADKWTGTPQGLGQYFSEMVERVTEKRNNSRAALVKEVEGQFKKQIEDSNKKNKELQDKLDKLTKAQQEAVKKHNEQVQALTKAQIEAAKKNKEQVDAIQKQHKEQLEKTNKQNEDLQKQLASINKTNADNMTKLQNELKEQKSQAKTQSDLLNANLKEMQKSNKELTDKFTSATNELNKEKDKVRNLENKLKDAPSKALGVTWMIIALLSLLGIVLVLILK